MARIFIKSIVATLLMLSMTVTAFGAEINCSPWARNIVEEAANEGFVPKELLVKATEVINRQELCELIVQFYNTVQGIEYEPKIESPFVDYSGKEVASAVELGFFSGVSDTEFDPYGKVTKEQMAVVMNKLAIKIGVPLSAVGQDYVKFIDSDEISYWALSSVDVLKVNGILNGDEQGYFNAQDHTTVEQAIVVIKKIKEMSGKEVDSNATAKISTDTIKVGGVMISLGDSKERLIQRMGEPDRISINMYGFERYVYNSDYRNFVMIGIYNGKVAEVYTNAESFVYGAILPTTMYEAVDFTGFNEYSSEKAVYTDKNYEVKIYFDSVGNKYVDGIYLRSVGLKEVSDFHSSKYETYIEEELLDIINSARVKQGQDFLERDENIDVIAKEHSVEMRKALRVSYYSAKGLSPFDRMKNAGIEYTLAAENISGDTKGDAIEIYSWWVAHAGTRSNLFERRFTHVGMGISASSARGLFFTTMDFVCE